MAAAELDLYIEQGATFRLTMFSTYRTGQLDTDGNEILAPYDLTGCKLRMQIRPRRGGPVLVSATTSNGGIRILDGPAGKFEITLTDEATDCLNVRRARYDLEAGFPSGDVIRMLEGAVRVSQNITQDADPGDIAAPWSQKSINEQDVTKDDLIMDQPSTA